MIDLRSDTVTKPTPEMRAAMAAAEVGDDVYGEDPTTNRLQRLAAEIFEKEAALFVPTGSMGNQIAVKVHTQPGQEALIEERGHILNYELGMSAVAAGVTIRGIRSGSSTGMLTWGEIAASVRVDGPYYSSRTGLICLENTHNFGGGSVMTADECKDICTNAHEREIPVHMDGARIFNAAVALNSSVADLTKDCDSVQFCLSKGLGAPVGSVLVGSDEFIAEARIWRKRLGGGMRQTGILAAAGLIALQDSPTRLHEDHSNAKALAVGLAQIPGIAIDVETVVTNIVIFDISGTEMKSGEICEKLRNDGVLAIGFGDKIRMVTHCYVSRNDVDVTLAALGSCLV
ncbi:MAG: GntG family PLP-dependent aldolase [Acidobacteriota bacterium]